jgi:hypothetical protein
MVADPISMTWKIKGKGLGRAKHYSLGYRFALPRLISRPQGRVWEGMRAGFRFRLFWGIWDWQKSYSITSLKVLL